MNSKLSIPKPASRRSFFQTRQLVLAAVLSLVLSGIWLFTSLDIPFINVRSPLYFTEAPYWHIGLYVATCGTMGYAIIGTVAIWLTRKDAIKKS